MPIPVVTSPAINQIYPPVISQQLATAIASLNVQSGTATLVAGTLTVSGVTLTATSVITCSRKTQGGTITSTVGYEAPGASRNTGAGTFVINAVVAAGTVAASDTSAIDWLVVG